METLLLANIKGSYLIFLNWISGSSSCNQNLPVDAETVSIYAYKIIFVFIQGADYSDKKGNGSPEVTKSKTFKKGNIEVLWLHERSLNSFVQNKI